MKFSQALALAFTLFIFACQPVTSPPTVMIVDGDQVVTLQTEERVVSALLIQAGITLEIEDNIFVNGFPATLDQRIAHGPINIEVRRAAAVTIITPDGQQTLKTSALTVGDALQEAGVELHTGDRIEPPPDSPLTDSPLTIYHFPAIPLAITADGNTTTVSSSARTVGEALAEAGIPLLGTDYSLPSEDEALPSDGQIKVVRVSESVLLAQKPIPFQSELVASVEVPLDQTKILFPGENGLSIQRVRVRYEDGVEVSRITEEETVVRTPKNRTLAYGTKVEIKTAVVDGVAIEYWRVVQMYATSYSPCRVGKSECSFITANSKELKKGVVAFRTDLYRAMKGQPLFIPGYGFATVEDACPGCVGKPWVDLGFGEDDYESWHWWVTVYFLTPVPQNIVYVLD